jgi:hypothetical protein
MAKINPNSQWAISRQSLIAADDIVPYNKFSSGVLLSAVCTFNACHLVGWNFEFPTNIEALLWKTATVCCLILPLVYAMKSLVLPNENEEWPLIVFLPLYGLIRLYLIVEVFFRLRRVPAGVYQTVQWAQFLPHI